MRPGQLPQFEPQPPVLPYASNPYGPYLVPQQYFGYGMGSFQGNPLVFNGRSYNQPASHRYVGRQYFHPTVSARPTMSEIPHRPQQNLEAEQTQTQKDAQTKGTAELDVTNQRTSPKKSKDHQPAPDDSCSRSTILLSEDEEKEVFPTSSPKEDILHLQSPVIASTCTARNSSEGKGGHVGPTLSTVTGTQDKDTGNLNCKIDNGQDNTKQKQQQPFLCSGRASETTWRQGY